MFKKNSLLAFFLITIFCISLFAAQNVSAYPNGPAKYITDAAPFCAGCHSSADINQLKTVPEKFAKKNIIEEKHYKIIRGDIENDKKDPYKKMEKEEREKLLKDVKLVDANSTVKLSGAASAKPGENITVTVETKGGGGPVIGIMLVDNNLRYQSRPVSADGWMIIGTPKVIGPDGKEQTKWIDGRYTGLKKNLNFVLVYDIKADIAAGKYSTSKVVYTLRAPHDPGNYTIAAAFLYGTEKASPVGYIQKIGHKVPIGRSGGRIKFSNVLNISVK